MKCNTFLAIRRVARSTKSASALLPTSNPLSVEPGGVGIKILQPEAASPQDLAYRGINHFCYPIEDFPFPAIEPMGSPL